MPGPGGGHHGGGGHRGGGPGGMRGPGMGGPRGGHHGGFHGGHHGPGPRPRPPMRGYGMEPRHHGPYYGGCMGCLMPILSVIIFAVVALGALFF